ncbi:MAG: DUF4349 domain-containing protein [Actinomycetota bacterium]|nr:DUF4349 domain-containing protein [Actinomycetota bacterium]
MSSKDVPTMIDEDELRTVLSGAAERYPVPPDGAEAVRSASRMRASSSNEPAPSVSWARSKVRDRAGRKTTVLLGGIAAAVILALLVSGISRVGHTDPTASSSARSSGVATTGPQTANGGAERLAPTTTGPASSFSADSAATASGGTAKALRQPATRSSSTPQAKAPAESSAGSEKIVKTGSIDLQVPRRTFSDRIDRLTGLATGLGGFVAETSTSEQDVTPTGTIALRVPAARFEDLLVQARRLGKVLSATSAAQDVTSEYTDITGRLKTMTDERDSLGLVLTDARNVPDVLAVRDRLNTVQAEIEQLQGRRNVLDDQTALATLTVSLHEPNATKPAPRPAAAQSGLNEAWHRAVDGFTGGIESIVAGSGKVLLVALCAAGLFLLGRPLWHRFRRALV